MVLLEYSGTGPGQRVRANEQVRGAMATPEYVHVRVQTARQALEKVLHWCPTFPDLWTESSVVIRTNRVMAHARRARCGAVRGQPRTLLFLYYY